jgi:hypothetical protein
MSNFLFIYLVSHIYEEAFVPTYINVYFIL